MEDDQLLYENMKKNESLPKLAAKLGRGLKGVESRIAKLNDVNSQAYQRLFVGEKSISQQGQESSEDEASSSSSGKKLTPVVEVMRRIKWDYSLDPDDFTVDYFDRVEETVMSTPFGAKNDSVKGKEEMFVFAIPEHRIMAIKYKERTVWDKVRTYLLTYVVSGWHNTIAVDILNPSISSSSILNQSLIHSKKDLIGYLDP